MIIKDSLKKENNKKVTRNGENESRMGGGYGQGELY